MQVIAREYSFTLSRTEVPAGKVIVELANYGQDEHNLHVTEPAEGSEAGSLPNTLPGAHPDLTLNLHPGSYTLFCSLKEHEAKGMPRSVIKHPRPGFTGARIRPTGQGKCGFLTLASRPQEDHPYGEA
ncbi:MAG: hypothetical protein ACREF0_12970 [Acetobacteraceae bacterium]